MKIQIEVTDKLAMVLTVEPVIDDVEQILSTRISGDMEIRDYLLCSEGISKQDLIGIIAQEVLKRAKVLK